MAQAFASDDDRNGDSARRGARDRIRRRERHHDHDDSHRCPAEPPSVEVARVVLKVDGSITLKRAAAAAWLTGHSAAVPARPIKPTRMELAAVIALAETFGAALYRE